jgi:phosphoribosyl-ATP pyrophosphohydrolase
VPRASFAGEGVSQVKAEVCRWQVVSGRLCTRGHEFAHYFSFFSIIFRHAEQMSDSIDRLFVAVTAAGRADLAESRTAQLLRSGRAKMAKKLAEEAVELVIDAVNGAREAVIRESADLVYHLVVLWAASGVKPADVWDEMARREQLLGIAEKLPKETPKAITAPPARQKVVALELRSGRKR